MGSTSFWRPAVSVHKPRRRTSSEQARDPVTLFLDNIPDSFTARGLFMLLNKFVKVQDVFIPGRRRLFTRSRFGFAIVNGTSNADVLIKKVNGLWVMDQMIVVKKAFGARIRTNGTSSHTVRNAQDNNNQGNIVSSYGKVGSPARLQMKSYADALKGMGVAEQGKPLGGLPVEEERTHWLYCSLIGTLAEGKDILSFKEEFMHIQPLPFQLTDCGGKLILLTFNSKIDRQRALSGDSMALIQWFQWLTPWSNGCRPGVLREAWVKCTGLPHQLWNIDNLARIGNIWGDVRRGDHVLNMMALAFGWVKVRTSALQPIAEEVSLVNNGVLYRIHVHEESVFTPEQWLRRSESDATRAGKGDDFQTPMELEQGWSTQRSHVSESWLSKGSGAAGIYRGSGTPLAAGPDLEEGEMRGGTPSAALTDNANISISPTLGTSIVPFVPSANLAQQQGCLVVDLGRSFGPIPLIEDVHALKAALVENVGQQIEVVDFGCQGNDIGGPIRHISTQQLPTSQEIIARLGGQGRLMEDPPTGINVPASSVRRGGGGVLKKRTQGAVVRAAAVASTRRTSPEMSQTHQMLLKEATLAWDIGRSLGLRPSGSDAEACEKIFGMELRDSKMAGCRG
ncbi:hypothetical protein Dimus_022518 [Dionaea muscipula]